MCSSALEFGDLGYVCSGGLLFFSLAILSCALVFLNCQFGDLGYVCLGALLFFLFGYSLMCSSFWNCQFVDLGYVCFSLAILSCALIFWNCQFGDLAYVCFGGLLFFSLSLFGYSLMRSSCFEIANLENLFRYINLSGTLDSRNQKINKEDLKWWWVDYISKGDIWFDNLDHWTLQDTRRLWIYIYIYIYISSQFSWLLEFVI
jgi:hypothetical protein